MSEKKTVSFKVEIPAADKLKIKVNAAKLGITMGEYIERGMPGWFIPDMATGEGKR